MHSPLFLCPTWCSLEVGSFLWALLRPCPSNHLSPWLVRVSHISPQRSLGKKNLGLIHIISTFLPGKYQFIVEENKYKRNSITIIWLYPDISHWSYSIFKFWINKFNLAGTIWVLPDIAHKVVIEMQCSKNMPRLEKKTERSLTVILQRTQMENSSATSDSFQTEIL